jgi:hypothetical protein
LTSGIQKMGAGGAQEDQDVLGGGNKKDSKDGKEPRVPIKKLAGVSHMLTTDSNGNMTIAGEVGYGNGQKGTAEHYIEKVNGTYTLSSESGDSITLTVNLSLAADGTGDFNVLSLNQLAAATGKSKNYLVGNDGRNGPCVVACAVPGKNYLYFSRGGTSTSLHETFHLFGFMHQTWGIMLESEYTSPVYQDFKDLRSTYFGN